MALEKIDPGWVAGGSNWGRYLEAVCDNRTASPSITLTTTGSLSGMYALTPIHVVSPSYCGEAYRNSGCHWPEGAGGALEFENRAPAFLVTFATASSLSAAW